MVTAEECWHKSLTPLMERVRQRIGDGPVYLSYDIVRPPIPPPQPCVHEHGGGRGPGGGGGALDLGTGSGRFVRLAKLATSIDASQYERAPLRAF